MKVKSESDVAQSCPTLSDPMDCSLPGSSVHGIFQAGILEWGAIALQHGIFPVILNKFHLFVLGIQIRITSLAQMQIQSHKRNIDSNCNHVTISLAIK